MAGTNNAANNVHYFSGSNGSFSAQTIPFGNLNGMSFYSSNGSMVGSYTTPSVATVGGFDPTMNLSAFANNNFSAGSIWVYPIQPPNMSFSAISPILRFTNATNTTGSATISAWIGIYTKNAATLSLLISQSTTYGMTASGTVNTSLNVGLRALPMAINGTLSAGNYYLGNVFSSSSAGAGGPTIDAYRYNLMNSGVNYYGNMNAASSAGVQLNTGLGMFSSVAYTMPNSMAISDIYGTNPVAIPINKIIFNG